MKKTVFVFLTAFLFIKCRTQSIEPHIVNATGGYFQSGYHYMEWNVGEAALIGQFSSTDNSIIITNGFIQPYILKPAANNINNFFADDEIKVFPNPASKYVEINFFTRQQGKLKFKLFDASGRKTYSGELISFGVDLIERIPLSHLAGGVYTLRVDLEPYSGSVVKKGVYKIVKVE